MAGNASLCDDDDFSPIDPSTDVYEHTILRASHVKLVPSVYRSTVDIHSRKKQPRNLRQNLYRRNDGKGSTDEDIEQLIHLLFVGG